MMACTKGSAVLVGIAAALLLSVTARAQSRGSLFPQTPSNIHLEMVFNYAQTDLNAETGVVDLVWGSSSANQPTGMYNSAYLPYSVDNFTNTVGWYQQNHPDWLEYQCDQKTLAFEFGNTSLAPLDISNPDVQSFQWANWIDAPLALGYQGIAVDTMSLSNTWLRCGHFDASGTWVKQYSGKVEDKAFRTDVLAWESATYAHVQQVSPTATMQINVSYQQQETQANNYQLMSTADLVFDERGVTEYGTGFPSTSEWLAILHGIQYVQAKGLCYMTNGEEAVPTDQITQTQRLWVIANYLLVMNNCSYMYMAGLNSAGQQDYGYIIIFPEYSIQIGSPTGKTKHITGAWTRTFSNGLTYVNPYTTSATVTLPKGSWVDVNGVSVGPTLTLAPQTGEVLLKAN
jgi:hypothetical protein